ncbi:MAG TPA: hypothetical protein VNU94_09875 [Acidobacteriaceae bacterium]|nr:hypothetical protein [Acidobacteriaceae bacterium]
MLALFLLAAGAAAYAAPRDDTVAASAAYSSSLSSTDALPDEPQAQSGVPPAPKEEKAEKPAKTASANTEKPVKPGSIRPFSTVGIDVKVGLAGAGFDIATPLARKFNLRGGASFFNFDHTFVSDGTNYDASIDLKSAMLAIDWFPFGGAFRLSPIVQLYNGNSMMANLSVPAGQEFSLGNQNSYSSVSNPVHGTANFLLGDQGGSQVAPGFTMGFGNIIPRKGHWSVPFEIGFLYIQTPQVLLNFQGTSCNTQADAATVVPGPSCVNIATDPTSQTNVKQEQTDINNNLNELRFFPVLSVGLSYKF